MATAVLSTAFDAYIAPTPVISERDIPSIITSAPTLQFTPGPGCLNSGNIGIVDTSCYILEQTAATIVGSDWLHCTVTWFGAPEWTDRKCYLYGYPHSTVQEGKFAHYQGCPVGYSAVTSSSMQMPPGYGIGLTSSYDITSYGVGCCPTQYSFVASNTDQQLVKTVHNGQEYDVFYLPQGGCAATSVAALSGKQVPVYTAKNDQPWDKKRQEPGLGSTVAWDYETATMFAYMQRYAYTVFLGTHTCYNYYDCLTLEDYYYPNGQLRTDLPVNTTPTTELPIELTTTSSVEASSSDISSVEIESTVSSSDLPTTASVETTPVGTGGAGSLSNAGNVTKSSLNPPQTNLGSGHLGPASTISTPTPTTTPESGGLALKSRSFLPYVGSTLAIAAVCLL